MKNTGVYTVVLLVLLLSGLYLMPLSADDEPQMNGIYQCYACYELVYSFGLPDNAGCTAENRATHAWLKLGDQGENVYQCVQCATVLQARYLYQNAPCSRDPRKMHYWNKLGTLGDKQYLCKYCNGYVYLDSKPSSKHCPYADKHEWGSLGKIGNRQYRCHYCKFEVYASSEPSRQSCSVNTYHHWVQLNVVDTQTVIRYFPVHCGLSFSTGNGNFYFNPRVHRKPLPKPEAVRPVKNPGKKLPIRVLPANFKPSPGGVVKHPAAKPPKKAELPGHRIPVKINGSTVKPPVIRVEPMKPAAPSAGKKKTEHNRIRLIGPADIHKGLRPFDGPRQQKPEETEQKQIIMVPEK